MRKIGATLGLLFLGSALVAVAPAAAHDRGHRHDHDRYDHRDRRGHDRDARRVHDRSVRRLAHRLERSVDALWREARHLGGPHARRNRSALGAILELEHATDAFARRVHRHGRVALGRELARLAYFYDCAYREAGFLLRDRDVRRAFRRVERLLGELQYARADLRRDWRHRRDHRDRYARRW